MRIERTIHEINCWQVDETQSPCWFGVGPWILKVSSSQSVNEIHDLKCNYNQRECTNRLSRTDKEQADSAPAAD
jgi:hypothetical protein